MKECQRCHNKSENLIDGTYPDDTPYHVCKGCYEKEVRGLHDCSGRQCGCGESDW